jgi:hypothetical protein
MEAPSFQQWLSNTTNKSIQLVITENRSILLSFKQRPDGGLTVRAHRMFLDAPGEIHEALANWIRGPRAKAREVIRRFIRSYRPPEQAELPLDGQTPMWEPRLRPRGDRVHLRPIGRLYDLDELRHSINAQYFDGKLTCTITWGRRTRSRARRHFTFGTYSHTQNLVRIHPRLDAPDVPRYFVEFIVYHEMLHAARGQEGERNGRRVIHSKEFRADERKFAQYREAIEWEKKNLGKFLGATVDGGKASRVGIYDVV